MYHVAGLALAGLVSVACGTGSWAADSAPPTDNPVATYYSGPEGYPAWTDGIHWRNAVDMSKYANGKTNFEKFENARDELAAKGGGVLYYPAGTYEFTAGPFDGPQGRGLLLKPGVVIRGAAPDGHPSATTGKLELKTRFVFGFQRRDNGVDIGDRVGITLESAYVRQETTRPGSKKGEPPPEPKTQELPTPLHLNFPVKDAKIQPEGKAYCRGYLQEHSAKVQVTADAGGLRLDVDLDLAGINSENGPGKAHYVVLLKRDGPRVTGSYTGTFREQAVKGEAAGKFFPVAAETPRAWNVISLCPDKDGHIKDVNLVGLAWVHLTGATIWFGSELQWGKTWRTADSWKSPYVKDAWAERVPNGTHPLDPFSGGGKTFVGSGEGRLVFGCVLQDSVVTNDVQTCGRPDMKEGFGPQGYYMDKFAPRVGVYGSRVLVANNLLPLSEGRNFKYRQTTRYTYPIKGSGMGFGDEKESVILFDYNKCLGIDVNKDMLGLTKESPTGEAAGGYYGEGVVVRDNYVANHGHKGFNLSGQWLSIIANRNERVFLKEGVDPYGIWGWELTLDGYLESAGGGNGAISDNLSRAFDLGGKNVWVEQCFYNNLGSAPGNDGEGILCQAHGGTDWYSWAVTHNKHEKGNGNTSYIGGWGVEVQGALIAWNELPGWVGVTASARGGTDIALVANQAGGGAKGPPNALTQDPGGALKPPTAVKAETCQGAAVKITWADASDNEVGFRVDRKIAGGAWTPVAYRPPHIEGSPLNPQAWVDFTAPAGKPLQYRVAAISAKDDDSGASAAVALTLDGPKR